MLLSHITLPEAAALVDNAEAKILRKKDELSRIPGVSYLTEDNAYLRTSEADPWDLLDSVDVIARLPADSSTNIESKKGTERRDALMAFLDHLTANPRLHPKASYGEHISLLKRIIEKDANINVAALATTCMKCVADGLRKKVSVPQLLYLFSTKMNFRFAPHAPAVYQ
ncbi:unnamed protein product [Cylicostephanus goldi]|uniref:Uncharacterized protein n=1 Tax=Cylicostephanus goldi TaxID=71465 RepID=A0A3P6ULQ2_CYLGO|nr:unnamed protein product [Cylicostephanus goldi]